jgi:ribonuclease Z
MIDCGALQHVAKRELKPVRAIFVTHAHMDHFMGFDAFLRQVHASPRTVEIFGPPGMADRVQARLSGYDWNLAETYWCTIMVHEVHEEEIVSSRFSGPERFRRHDAGSAPRQGEVIYRHNHMEVAAVLLHHGIPVLAFRLRESKIFAVDMEKMAARGLVPGPWLPELKRRFFADWPPAEPLTVARMRGEAIVEEPIADAEGLYAQLRGEHGTASIGYLTDCGYLPENRRRIGSFLAGVTLLVGECAFLARDGQKARLSHHLCTTDWNQLLAELQPRLFLPFHLSKTYLGKCPELFTELVPPAGTTILRLPEHRTPRPIFASEARPLPSGSPQQQNSLPW